MRTLNLANNIKNLTEGLRLTLRSIAEETHIDVDLLKVVTRGTASLSLDQIHHLADFFDVTLDELCYEPLGQAAAAASSAPSEYKGELHLGDGESVFEVTIRRK